MSTTPMIISRNGDCEGDGGINNYNVPQPHESQEIVNMQNLC